MWTWLPQHDAVLTHIKELVTNYPILKYYNVNEGTTIQCEKSERKLGASLLQEKGQPVAFMSRSLSPTEQRYAQVEKESLAIVFSCAKFNQYVQGQETISGLSVST